MFTPSQNRLIWLAMLTAIAVLGYQTHDRIEGYLRGVGRLDVATRDNGRVVEMTWRGEINAPMEQRIQEAYTRHRDSAETFVLSLASPGGSLGHGARVVRVLNDIARSHALETVVDAGRRCASMCVPIYLQGERRRAGESAYFMFHNVSFRDFFEDEAATVPAAATTAATDELFSRYFAPAGVPDAWIRQLRSEMTGGDDVWRTAAQLYAQQSNIVQVLE